MWINILSKTRTDIRHKTNVMPMHGFCTVLQEPLEGVPQLST